MPRSGRAGLRLGRRLDRPAEYPPGAAERKAVSSWCDFGVAWKAREQDAHDVRGGTTRVSPVNPPRLFCGARVRKWPAFFGHDAA